LIFRRLFQNLFQNSFQNGGDGMAGRPRHWREKDGRFYARIGVPAALRPFVEGGKSELIEVLGADRREALRKHPAAVARLQAQLDVARVEAGAPVDEVPGTPKVTITPADFAAAIWSRYRSALEDDLAARDRFPDDLEIAAETVKLRARLEAGEIPDDWMSRLDASLDLLVMKNARGFDSRMREVRLTALQKELAAGQTHQIEHEIDLFLEQNGLAADRGTSERKVLAKQMMRAEIEVLKRSLERDVGDYGGQPSDPIVAPPAQGVGRKAVKLTQLWADYVEDQVLTGLMKDRGRRQSAVIRDLVSFLGHDDARRIRDDDLIAWKDYLIRDRRLKPKTISDIYLSTVRSLFKWAAAVRKLLPENVADGIRQRKPKETAGREKGFTDVEAVAVLRASRSHVPRPNQFGYVRETPHMTAAKLWAPLLAAFSGARISEITQMRKEDFRLEGGRWVVRITPEAGSIKAGGFRDVPLHRQIISEGFIDFVAASSPGPLFHGAKDPARYAQAAQNVSDELAKWLRDLKVIPAGVRPNHGWRHRFKTQALELEIPMRIADAIQGHTSRTSHLPARSAPSTCGPFTGSKLLR
jgi:integrase